MKSEVRCVAAVSRGDEPQLDEQVRRKYQCSEKRNVKNLRQLTLEAPRRLRLLFPMIRHFIVAIER